MEINTLQWDWKDRDWFFFYLIHNVLVSVWNMMYVDVFLNCYILYGYCFLFILLCDDGVFYLLCWCLFWIVTLCVDVVDLLCWYCFLFVMSYIDFLFICYVAWIAWFCHVLMILLLIDPTYEKYTIIGKCHKVWLV
jgi:hypothetical protein